MASFSLSSIAFGETSCGFSLFLQATVGARARRLAMKRFVTVRMISLSRLVRPRREHVACQPASPPKDGELAASIRVNRDVSARVRRQIGRASCREGGE